MLDLNACGGGVMSPAIEHEARRVAAAFGAKEWEETSSTNQEPFRDFRGYFPESIFPDNRFLALVFDGEQLVEIEICEGVPRWQIPDFIRVERSFPHDPEWELVNRSDYAEQMVKGLCCLGFEDAAVLSQLPELTAHEKLELRLSMPREYWPQGWLQNLTKRDLIEIGEIK